MPIGKQSINRVAKKADVEETTPAAEVQPTKEKKPSTAKKSGSCATRAKTAKPTPPKADITQETTAPAVTEHVIANIDPAVVEAVVGKPTPAPKDGKVKVTDPMPSYLL
ncbi:MAG: hypothetical protein IIW17_09830 [Clostridia bacterium]|nr:hypothetical protein [Clostridia bacterium]